MRLGWQRKLVGSAGPEPFGFRLVIVRDQLACSCTSVPAHLFAMCVRTKGCAFDFSLSLSLSLSLVYLVGVSQSIGGPGALASPRRAIVH